jgi:NAD(P)-dependent dehydrogenase (short-subunit alcohol dehydrogenase family)
MKLAGQVAVVTGASRGIGRAVALALAAEGAAVAGCSLTGPFDDTGRVPGFLPNGLLVRCDVRRRSEVTRFRETVLAEMGVPHVVVNNAGTVARGPFVEMEPEIWDDVIASNLRGTFLVSRAFLPEMVQAKRGRVINMSSIAGRQGTAMLAAYNAAKHGVVGLTRSLAEELRPAGIAVNAVCPGSVDTEMLKVGMPGGEAKMTPDDVARVVAFLATDAPLALTGSCVDVFG